MNDAYEKLYWDRRYARGEDSGVGSRGKSLRYKADFLNYIFKKYEIGSVFDFGCGDGQLASLLNVKLYFGIDVSVEAVRICRLRFMDRIGYYFECAHFFDYTPEVIREKIESLDCIMCIDVLYHIIDKDVLVKTIENIFGSNAIIVILYTYPLGIIKKDRDMRIYGMYARDITNIVERFIGNYELVAEVEPVLGSASGFLIYRKGGREVSKGKTSHVAGDS